MRKRIASSSRSEKNKSRWRARRGPWRARRVEGLEPRTLLSVGTTDLLQVPQANPAAVREAYMAPQVQASSFVQAGAMQAAALPTSYDLRTGGMVTPVKNQGTCGSCWSFATYGSLESTLLKQGFGTQDLSENNLKDYHGFDWGPCDGGNSYISEAYLSRGSGPVSEANDPYHDYDDRVTPAPSYPRQYYVREALRFDTDAEMKNAVMTYGAVDTSMYWTDASYHKDANGATYYYGGTPDGNHDVTIVGWDDAKVVTGTTTPGAWLIKNSWGSGWGDSGYFWLSYADTSGGNGGTCFCNAAAASTYNNVYYWDTFGDVSELSSPYGMNAFTAKGSEDLKAVQFWTEADGATYTVKIYDTYSGGVLSNQLGTTVTGTETYAGYHTVDLPSAIHLAAGNDFYVVLNIANGGSYPMAFDFQYSGYDSACTASAGQSYYSFNGTSWTDLTTFDATANFGIKALTTNSATAPTVTSLTASPVTIADATAGTGTFSLTAVYSTTMNTSVAPTISFPTENPAATLTLNTAASGWGADGKTYVAKYNVADANTALANVDVRVIGAKDAGGNTQTQADFADKFSIDTLNPSVASVTPNLATVADANAGTDAFTLTVVYGEAMNTSVKPTISFPVENPSATLVLDATNSTWTNSTTFLAKYTVSDANVALAGVDVRVTGAADAAGNAQAPGDFVNKFSIDTLNPSVASVTPNPATVTDANVGADAFTLTVLYGEAMNTSVAPTISFPVENPSATLTFDAATSGWGADGKTYVARYTVADAGVALANVDVRVAGAKDAVGNSQAQTDLADKFSIDTLNPTAKSVSASPSTITDSYVGSGKFTLTVTYSEAMNTSVAPTISFPVENPSATITLNASLSKWTSSTTYAAKYDVVDSNTLLSNVDVRVTGGKDAAGNAPAQADFANKFSIQTQAKASSVTPSPTTIVDATAGTGTFSLTVVYSQAMNTAVAPTISFPVENPSTTLTLNASLSGWTNSTTYVAKYNVADAGVKLANIDVRVTGAQDAKGVAQAQGDFTNKFSIDMQNPTVKSVTPSPAKIVDATAGTGTFSLTVVFSEAMKTTVVPTITFPVENPSGTITLNTSASSWTNSTTYVAKYDVVDANTTLSNIDVRVAAAQDAAGNTQTASTLTNKFNIDTRNPTVSSVTPNLTTIAAGNAGTDKFTLTVVFAEAMSTSVAPTISFPVENPGGTLVLDTTNSVWSNSTTYVAKYNVVNLGLTLASIDVRVAGAKDAAGNTQTQATLTNKFGISMGGSSGALALAAADSLDAAAIAAQTASRNNQNTSAKVVDLLLADEQLLS